MKNKDDIFEYGAISIDNSILKGAGYRFHNGLLSKLKQFKGSDIRIVQSDIVHKECEKHILNLFESDSESIKSSIDKLKERVEISSDDIDKAMELLLLRTNPKKKTKDKLDAFYNDIGAQVIVSGDYVDLNEIVRMYFDSEAPFENTSKKKNEFPDAIALMALDAWAEKNHTKVLAVSGDKGWVDYAQKSENIDISKNLPDALQRLQPQRELQKLVANIANSNILYSQDIYDAIKNNLLESDLSEIEVNFHSSFEAEIYDINVIIEDCALEFDEFDRVAFSVINIDVECGFIEVMVTAEVIAEFSVDIEFKHYDNYDGDIITISNDNFKREVSYEVDALVYIHFGTEMEDIDDDSVYIEISDITNNMEKHINLGGIDPHFMMEDY